MIGLGLSLTTRAIMRSSSAPAFSPSTLFASSEPGVWYDPSDLTTLFTDTAGTTPVTTAGQSVARINDKSGRGNNATQATAASRPTYGVVPLGGRRNLLLQTEAFSESVWQKSNATVTADTATAPNGTTAADRAQFSLGSTSSSADQIVTMAAASQTFTVSAWVKSNTGSSQTFRLKCTHIGVADYFSSVQTATTDWQRFTFTQAFGAGGTGVRAGLSGGSSASDILIWGAQLELGSTATAYQRVSTAFDVTEAGVQSLSYLSFDGVDDFMLTGTITPGVDKAQVFAGVRKLSDATRAILAESGATGTDAGSFGLNAPRDTSRVYLFTAGGSTLTSSQTTSTAFAAPVSNVVSGLADIAADSNTLRVNGTVAGTVATDQGTGNFANLPIYIGRRGGTTFPFNGNIFSLLVRFGANLTTPQITDTETWVAGKTGVTL